MREKIIKNNIITCIVAVILTVTVCVLAYAYSFEKNMNSQAQAQAVLLKHLCTESDNMLEDLTQISKTLQSRVTFINSEGRVIFDSNYDAQSLENHLDRQEISSAATLGAGSAKRYSSTDGKTNYYYAVKVANLGVVRVGVSSAYLAGEAIMSALPIVLLFIILVLVFCIWIASRTTKNIVSTIENYDIESQNSYIYDELSPFIKKINSQRKTIDLQQVQSQNMRREFTANVTHELKTPLTSILGYSQLINNKIVKPEDVVSFTQIIENNAVRLLSLIDDILKVSQLDEMQSFEKENLNLSQIVTCATAELSPIAQSKKINIETDIQDVFYTANSAHMQDMVRNILSNAIKYNKENGNVWIKLFKDEKSVVLSIKDDGIGIDTPHQDKIFERFYVVDKSRNKTVSSTGLGLSIVKHIVNCYNGEIKLISSNNSGSEFIVSLPINS